MYLVLCSTLMLLLFINYSFQFATKTGTNGYITYQVGGADTRVIISASHGGTLKPDNLSSRPAAGCYDAVNRECMYTATCETPAVAKCSVRSKIGDLNTNRLAREVADAIKSKLGGFDSQRPHVIINNLHRSKMDANRDLAEATFGNAAAQIAWNEYHSYIDMAKKSATVNGNEALYVDIHGQNLPENWTMIGVLLPNNKETGLKKASITDRLAQYSSIQQLHYHSSVSMEELVRGDNSIGGLLQANGYKTVPSPAHPDAGNSKFFEGGYSMRRHTGWTVSGFQVEVHYNLRRRRAIRRNFADKLADAINTWISNYYN